MKNFLYQSVLDIVKMGPRFFFNGIRASWDSNSTFAVKVPGVGSLLVRAGDSDFESVRQVFRGGEYEIVIQQVNDRVRAEYDRILATGKKPVVIDAGANIGAASLWFAQQYPEAAVIAIEPDPDNVRILTSNSENRGIAVLEAAIGGQPGFVSVVREGQSWGVQTARADSGLRIITVEDALSTVNNGELFIVKVDIEGFESDLFASNTNWIDQAFVIYVEPHDWLLPGRQTSRTFQRELAKREFEIFINRENLIFVR
jgi:FkbM family methyltransferase